MAVGVKGDKLIFEFPEVHPEAVLEVTFERTLRVPDDGRAHKLPPSLGRFPVKSVDDLNQERLPQGWSQRGGVAFPMWQAEAMWIRFRATYPFAVKIGAGKVNALTGEPWRDGLDHDRQDYVVVPDQPWLDGYADEAGEVRQFVAMPLGKGYTAEEQITREAKHGGLQIVAHPMTPEARRRRRSEQAPRHPKPWTDGPWDLQPKPGDPMEPWIDPWKDVYPYPHPKIGDFPKPDIGDFPKPRIGDPEPGKDYWRLMESLYPQGIHRMQTTSLDPAWRGHSCSASVTRSAGGETRNADMGLAPGGSIRQEVFRSRHAPGEWADAKSRCFVAIASSLAWRHLAGERPPTTPPTAADYAAQGLPWFEHYGDSPAIEGGDRLKRAKSVLDKASELGESPLPENETFDPDSVPTVQTGSPLPRSRAPRIREGAF